MPDLIIQERRRDLGNFEVGRMLVLAAGRTIAVSRRPSIPDSGDFIPLPPEPGAPANAMS